MIDAIVRLIRQAGAATETDTDRDGAFSYSGEFHSAGIAFGAVLVATITGNPGWTILVVGSVLRGTAEKLPGGPHWRDLVREPAYALAASGVGLLVGRAIIAVQGVA